MPVRIASLSRQIHKNGQRLHLAMKSRAFSKGPEVPAAEPEQALRELRNLLRAEQKRRQAEAALPRPKVAKFVPKEAKPAKPAKPPKAPKAAKPPKEAKAGQANKPSRADKVTKKAENVEAAKKADRKSAKT